MARQTEADILIDPRQGRREQRLPKRALLVVNPSEASSALHLFAEYQPQRRTLYNSNLLVDKTNSLCLAGPALGAPAAGLVVEKLIALGVSDIVLISCCGAIDPALAVGDCLLATGGVVGEGVSPYYLQDQVVYPSERAVQFLRHELILLDLDFREGVLWSTDAPYRERRSELFGLQEQYGVAGVDMEFSALCSIAAFRQVSCAGLFVVSDELWGQEWKPGFTATAFRHKMHAVLTGMIKQTLEKEQNGT